MAYERLCNPKYIKSLLEKEAGACSPTGVKKLSCRFSKLFQRLRKLEEK